MQLSLALDGHCSGPLFGPVRKVRPAKHAMFTSGGSEVWAKYIRARPPWTTHAEVTAFWQMSRERTLATGVQHSVDHIVPLQHPMVCGLHCPANMRVIPLSENQRKGNLWWPDSWMEQQPLFT